MAAAEVTQAVSAVDPTIVVLIGGQVLAVIAALGAAAVAVINALRMNDLKRQQETNTNEIVTVGKDTAAIKGHVNSEKTAAEGRELLLRNENLLLKDRITDIQMTARLLAQAAAQRGRDPHGAAAAAAVAASVETPELLESIDKNTAETAAAAAETAANTARTEASTVRAEESAARTEEKLHDLKK